MADEETIDEEIIESDEEGEPEDPDDAADTPPVDEEAVPDVEDEGERPEIDWSETATEGDPGTAPDNTPFSVPAIMTKRTRSVTRREPVTDYSQASLDAYSSGGYTAWAIYSDGTEQQVPWSSVVEPVPVSQVVANEAMAVAEATGQHFWDRSEDPDQDGSGTGAFVTDEEKADFLEAMADDIQPTTARPLHNLLMNAEGILLRAAKRIRAAFTPSGVAFFDGTGNQAENITARFGTDGAQIGTLGSTHISIDNDSLDIIDDNGAVVGTFGADGAMIGTFDASNIKILNDTVDMTDYQGISAFKIEPLSATSHKRFERQYVGPRIAVDDSITIPLDPVADLSYGSIIVTVKWRMENGYPIGSTTQYGFTEPKSIYFGGRDSDLLYITIPNSVDGIIVRCESHKWQESASITCVIEYVYYGIGATSKYVFGFSYSNNSGAYALEHGELCAARGARSIASGIGVWSDTDALAIGRWNDIGLRGGPNQDKYALTIGNGTDWNARSNALTVDWQGNVECGEVNGVDMADVVVDSDLAAVATSGVYSDLTGTPTLATVATSGSYNDLSNKPTILGADDVPLLKGATALASGTDLDDIVSTGTYYATSNNAANISNCPVAGAFKMTVERTLSTATYLKQRFELYDAVNQWVRFSTNGGSTWSAWFREAPHSSQSATANRFLATPNGSAGLPEYRAIVAADIPSLGAGKITSGTFDDARIPDMPERYAALKGGTELKSTDDLDDTKTVGTYYVTRSSNTPQNAPTGFSVGKVIVDIPHGYSSSAIRGQHYISYSTGREAYRKFESGSWSDWTYEPVRGPRTPQTYDVKSLITQTSTQSGNFTISAASLVVSGFVAMLVVDFTIGAALTANTEYSLGTLPTSIRPAARANAGIGDSRFFAAIASGVMYLRPQAATSAGTSTYRFNSTYIMSNAYTG